MLFTPTISAFSSSIRPRAVAWLGLLGSLGLAACTTSNHPGVDADAIALRTSAGAPVVMVSLGEATTCATLLDGRAKCWGRGDQGRLGLGGGLTDDEPEPAATEALELGAGAVSVVTNGAQSFALLDDGGVRAFGLNDAHELGLGHTQTVGDDETPAGASIETLVPLPGPVLQLAAGEGFACALLDDGRVQCWGHGDEGQLGRGVQLGSHPPGDVDLGGLAEEIALGSAHACARLGGGKVRCWGRDDQGQLGYGNTGSLPPATAGDVLVGGSVIQLVAGGAHTCARLSTGTLRCWGANASGQLGHGHMQSIGDDEDPAAAGDVPLGAPVVSVAAGARHTCALLEDGDLRCWGDGTRGQLGLTTGLSVGDDELPTDVDPVDSGGPGFEAIFAGAQADHTCALLGDGALRCWGFNVHGQLGLGLVDPGQPVEGPPGEVPDIIVVDDPEL